MADDTALGDKEPPTPFRAPRGITMMRINQLTGEPAQPGDKKVITEVFKTGSGNTGNWPPREAGPPYRRDRP